MYDPKALLTPSPLQKSFAFTGGEEDLPHPELFLPLRHCMRVARRFAEGVILVRSGLPLFGGKNGKNSTSLGLCNIPVLTA